MAIYQPKNNNNLRHSIDATVSNQISLTMATNNTIIAYELFIYNIDDTLFYDSGKKTLNPTLYNEDVLNLTIPANTLTNGTNYKYGVRLWQDFLDIVVSKGTIQSITSQTQFSVLPNTNIKVGMYIGIGAETRQITAYDSNTGMVTIATKFTTTLTTATNYFIVSNFIDQFPLENLYVRNTPQIYITNVQNISTKSYTFIGQYIQQQTVPLTEYTFKIWQVSTPENILLMTYTKDSAKIECTYDGFLNGQNYLIELVVTNEFNITVSTGQKAFTASYDMPDYLSKPQITYIPERNANQVQFQADTVVPVSTQKLGSEIGAIIKVNSSTNYTINQNLNIQSGDEIVIDYWNKANVIAYTRSTGILIVDSFKLTPSVGNNFYINKKSNLGEVGVELMYNTPYRRVNSMQLNSSLVYEGSKTAQGIINDMPEKFQLTMQLKFNNDFLQQTHNNKYNYTNVIDINCDSFGCIGLHVGIVNPNILVVLIPNGTTYQTVSNGTKRSMILSTRMDFDKSKFVIFRDFNNYIARISSYDKNTKTVIFEKELPFIPNGSIWIPNSLIKAFQDGITPGWLLQEAPPVNESIHTGWDDTKKWDDNLYWSELNDFASLVGGKWWKIQINNTKIKIAEGGV